jgi:hypothetical protein
VALVARHEDATASVDAARVQRRSVLACSPRRSGGSHARGSRQRGGGFPEEPPGSPAVLALCRRTHTKYAPASTRPLTDREVVALATISPITSTSDG